MTTITALREKNREFIERLELQRDKYIDIIGVYGPLAAPAVPAILTAIAIAKIYPDLLEIHQQLATSIGIASAIVIEILGIVSIDMLFDMISFNHVKKEDEDPAPTKWAVVIVSTYLLIVIGLVFLLKVFEELATVSLLPLTLLGFITVWCVVLRSQHTERKYAHVMKARRDDVLQKLRDMLQSDDVVDAVTSLQNVLHDVTEERNNVTVERNTLSQALSQVNADLDALNVTCNAQNDEITRLKDELLHVTRDKEAIRNSVTFNDDTVTNGDKNVTPQSVTRNTTSVTRRRNVLQLLRNTSDKDGANFTDWANQLETTRQTISRDYKYLVENGYWLNGSDWEITKKGQEFIHCD